MKARTHTHKFATSHSCPVSYKPCIQAFNLRYEPDLSTEEGMQHYLQEQEEQWVRVVVCFTRQHTTLDWLGRV